MTIEKMTRARTGLVMDHPFFGSLSLRLNLEPDDSVPLAAVNGKVLKFNPAAVDALTNAQIKYLVAHEVMHCAMNHHTRRGGRDHKLWNAAGDFAINQILDDAAVGSMPEGGLISPAYRDMSADAIYAALATNIPGNAPDGSGATGTVEDAPTPGAGEPGKDGQPQPQPGAGEAERSAQENDWKVALAQAAQQAKALGELPGALERFAAAAMAPEINWKAELRRFMVSTKEATTWSPPNRRFIASGLYLPSTRSLGIERVVVAVDNSGSVSDSMLSQFAAEIGGILEDFPSCTVTVIYCDSKVNHAEDFTAGDLPLTLKATGGGGTAFQPVFDYVEEQGIDPACLVYLTDLGGPDPKEPHYPVLWASYGDQAAPFGELIPVTL